MNLTKSILFLTALSTLNGCIVVAKPNNANYHQNKELMLAADDLNQLNVEAGAGNLIIRGSSTAQSIVVRAEIFTTAKMKDNYELTLTRSGNNATLVSQMDSTSGFWVGESPHIDLVVTVPSNLMLDINDGSGDLYASDINADVFIKDGSGDVDISNIVGSLSLEDGSGELKIKDITGQVNIDDGSGDIRLKNVVGNVSVEDGSGELVAENIQGTAVFDDNSGDLRVRHVSGMVTVSDGSGDIVVEDAGGLKIIEDGSGDLRIRKVKGNFEVDS